ncbi:MAG TPA: hypothetical protein VIM85_05315 [Pseudomonadales bacterium]
MQALAEYIMRRRFNAVAVAFVCALLPLLEWLGAAAVALVTLRKGWQEGVFVLTWACMSGGLRWAVGDVLILPTLVLVFCGAAVLRQSVSLLYAIITTTALSALVMVLFQKVMPIGLERLVTKTGDMFAELQLLEKLAVTNPEQWIVELALTGFGLSVAVMALAGLLIGRWWQAKLYYPGGFQDEFHQLRLSPLMLATLAAVAVVAVGLVPQLRFIGALISLPVFLVGVSLVHSVAKILGFGLQVLALFYVLLILFSGYVYLLLLLLVIADSFINIRQRLARTNDQ